MNSDSFSFLVISDIHYGRYDSALITAQNFYTHTPYDFLIVNGDITQRGLASEWESFERDRVELSVPLYLSIGNHDLFNEGEEQFYHYFGPTHYAFMVGEVLFVFLDTGNGVLSQKAKAWYLNLLQTTKARHILAFTHYSYLLTKIEKMVALPNPEEFYWMVNTNATYGVDALISGHLHRNLAQTLRGTYYVTVANSASSEEQGLLITYIRGEITYRRVSL